ncbi:hypothetical protein ACR1PO_15595 [Chryseobacterium sp. RRHN12]|uniref:hypothetical protein n=1 Tax=Chryseobacterium sp. RRHN12 TaxID=3437884 RepID=UPI003D9B3D3D
MENTLENKAKFFAQYWGQRVGNFIGSTGLFTISQLYLKKSVVKQSWLELKPLSSITDEDKIRIKKIENIGDEENPEAYFHFGNTYNQSYYSNEGFERFMLLDTYQYLQSKGYALPWMGLSVEKQIEYGWIKLKNTDL